MDSDTQIQTDDQAVQVQTETGTGAEGYLFGEMGVVDDSVVELFVELKAFLIIGVACFLEDIIAVIPVPHIAGINKSSSEEFPDNRETEFEIRL